MPSIDGLSRRRHFGLGAIATPSDNMPGSRSGLTSCTGGRSESDHAFVGLDVSVRETSVCVVDDASKVMCERKVLTEPNNIAAVTDYRSVLPRADRYDRDRRPQRTPGFCTAHVD